MQLLTETWFAACCWASSCTICSIVWPDSPRRCSIHGQRQRERRALALQAARELGDIGIGQRRRRARHVGDDRDQLARRLGRDLEHAVGPGAGGVAVDVRDRDPRGDPPQVLDQREPQHDRERPQLAEQQRLRGLVRRDEAAQRTAADLAVAVRDRLQREVVDARQAGAVAVHRRQREARQLAAVAARQVAPRRCGSLPRSGRSCRAATRPPA
jgi:hypothetical protein